MMRIGIWLIILGLGSFILPLFGLQFKLLSFLGEATPVVGIIAAVVGAILAVVGFTQKNKAQGVTTSPDDNPERQ